MWLLDVNLPNGLAGLLHGFGISCDTAARRNGLGKLYRRAGNGQQAQEHLTTAITMYHEMDMRFWLHQVEAELRQCNDGTKGWTGA